MTPKYQKVLNVTEEELEQITKLKAQGITFVEIFRTGLRAILEAKTDKK